MATVIACQACGTQLKVPDNLGARKAKCPRCGAFIVVGKGADLAARPAPKSPPKAAPAVPKSKPIRRPAPKPEDDDEVEVAQLDDEVEVAQRDKTAETANLDAKANADRHEEEPKKKKKKKKRNKRLPDDDESTGAPVWAWWAGAFGALLLIVLAGFIMAMKDETPGPVLFLAVKLVILMPVGFIILIISFLLSNVIAGGIDFGELSKAIPKAILLLLAANVLELFDLPFFIDSALLLIIWMVGLIVLFHLDIWESWFVIFVNWVLMKLAFFAVIMLILMIATRGGKVFREPDTSLPGGPLPTMPNQGPAPGGNMDDDQ